MRGELLDAVELGVLVHDSADTICYANPAAARLLGTTVEEIVGRSSVDGWDVVALDGTPLYADERPLARVRATGAPLRDVVVGVSGPGGRRWLRIDAKPLEGGNVLVAFVDLTNEVRSVQAAALDLEAHEERYAAVLRAMSEGVVVHAPDDGAIQFCNPAAERILGLSFAQMAGREAIDPRWSLLDADGQPLVAEAVPSEITRCTGRPCRDVRLGVRRPDGERVWVSVSTDPIAGEGDPSRGVVATFTDVTRERDAIQEQERASARLRDVTASVPGLLLQLSTTPSGEVHVSFAGGRDLPRAGLHAAALTAPGALLSALHPDDRVPFARALLAASATASPLDHTCRAVGPDGPRFVEVTATPAHIPTSSTRVPLEPTSPPFTAVVLDVHEQHLVAERMELDQRRQAIGELVAGVAHNFNNLLAVIQPNLSELHDNVPAARLPELDDALEATERAADLVRQLLVVTRGDLSAEQTRIDLCQLVREVGRLCQRSFDGSYTVEIQVPSSPAWTVGVAGQLHQVLLNLALNARDAMLSQSVRKLTLSLETEPDGFHRVVVADTGVGMSAATRKRVGTPFFTTKGTGVGTGLGVATAFRAVRDAGGTMEIESTLGVGSRFIVRLPVDDGATLESEPPASPLVVPRVPLVLVVDDEPLVARALARLAQQVAVEVITVGSGREALAMLETRADELSVVLLDLAMPEVSGQEVLAHLRVRWPRLPVVVISGAAAPLADLDGAAAILEKPVDAATLRATLRVVARTRAERATP